jgi:hypothetical protein
VVLLFATLAGALGLSGCAGFTQARAEDAQFAALKKALPGHYDNASQVSADERAGRPGAHAAVDLLIMPADAAMIGTAVFYVRQSSTTDARRVLSQRIWVLGRAEDVHTKKPYTEQHLYVFKEPQRWLDVEDEPELLQSLLPQDLRQLTGCELLWSQSGADFEAHRKAESCRPAARSEGLLVEQRFELHGEHLALIQQQVGADGLLELSGSAVEPFYRFERRGGAN